MRFESKWKNKTHELVNGKRVMYKPYDAWHSMMRRCYSEKALARDKTYIGCSVCEEWHNYDVFHEWFKSNYKEGFFLDKDLVIKGNKEYSPNACRYVPKEINALIIKSNASRGKYPIGVSFMKNINKYISYVNIRSKLVRLGFYNTIEEAFNAYKKAKENHVRSMANEYYIKDLIDRDVYYSLMNYTVNIND